MSFFCIDGKSVCVFPAAESEAPVIYLNTFAEEGAQVFEKLQKSDSPSCTLVAISDLDWDHDMSPWDCPPLFKNAAPCSGGADEYLSLLTRKILPAVEQDLGGVPCWRAIAGYSLAGLFALYAIYRTDLFQRVASMSGSLWFPGIREYLFAHRPKQPPDCLYLSLGDRESHTRHPFFRQVEENTREIYEHFQNSGIKTEFTLNPGNHNDHPIDRTVDGLLWLLRQQGN